MVSFINKFSKIFKKFINFPILNGFLLGVLLIFFLKPNISFLNYDFGNKKFYLLSILLFISFIFSFIKSKYKIDPIGILYSLLFLIFTNALNSSYSLLIGPIIKGEIILFTFLLFILINNKKQKLIYYLFLLSPIILCFIFLYEGHKGIVWSDDNPTFIYRLEALKRFFPNIPFYYTGWNSGLDARDFFATGALNIFFLAYPLIKFLDIFKHYNLILAYLLFFILPISSILACKILKKDFKFMSIVTILTVTNSLFWYRWALKYGTLGFITSSSLVPLVFVLTSKLLNKDDNLNYKEAILLVLSTTLLLLWSGAGLVFIPCILYGFLFLKRVLTKKYSIKIILSLILINLPWITIFWSASNVSNFLTKEKNNTPSIETSLSETKNTINISKNEISTSNSNTKQVFKTKVQKISFEKAIKNFRETFVGINTIIYLFLIPSIFFLKGTFRNLYVLTVVWLLFLGTTLSQVKPQMEFDRMLIILSILSIISATKCITHILEKPSTYLLNFLKALILSFILTSLFSTGSILRNRTLETYHHINENVYNLVNFLKNYETSGRVLFSGFILHDFGGGHIAPLAFMTNKQLIASSPFHNIWKYTDVIPKEFLGDDNKIENYLKLQNVQLIVAHERHWRDYFLKNANFEEVYKFYNYKVFRYKNFTNSYILDGKAKDIKIFDNKIMLTPLSKNIVLKFNYYPFLKASNCDVNEAQVSDSLKFIKLTNCNLNTNVTIKSKNAILRVLKK